MKIVVSVQALFDGEEEVAWGYHHEEMIVGEKADIDPSELVARFRKGEAIPPHVQEEMDVANRKSAGKTLETILEQLDRARESIVAQAATDMVDSVEDDGPPGS